MGTVFISGLTSSSVEIGLLSAVINPVAGIIIAIAVIVLIIVGFLVIKYKSNTSDYNEDLEERTNRGVARNNLDI